MYLHNTAVVTCMLSLYNYCNTSCNVKRDVYTIITQLLHDIHVHVYTDNMTT